ncbi:carbohydrate kinase [Escherichia coli]|nr:carbohydrate kinase [Escherichia coli]
MHRIDTKTAQKDKFGAGKNGFTRGNPQTGTPATDLDDDYFDMLQEELCSVVEASGASLEKGRHDQLLTALRALLLSRKNPFGDIKSDGTVKTALENLGLHETGFATLTTSGSFTVPAGVTELCISAVAGGGGGGSGGGGDSSFFGGGGGSGGAGESIVKRKFAVTPGTVINITIGSGGVGSIASTATGSAPTAGGNTVIGSLITLHGGQPGINAGNGQTTAPGGGYGQGFPTGSYGGDGNLNVGSGNGAPGASSPFGGGGGAGRAGTDQGTDGTAGSGYGSGGGSGGGKYGTGSFVARGGNGGNGAPGIVMIEW